MKNSAEILNKDKSSNGILRLVMNDIATSNSLSENMMKSLLDSINNASEDKDIKVIVIASSGGIFCSGHNLKEINSARNDDDEGGAYYQLLFNQCSMLMQSIVNCTNLLLLKLMVLQLQLDVS